MKFIFAVISLALAAKATAGGTYSLPKDAPDGIYRHYIDKSGKPAYEKLDTPISTPAPHPRSASDTLIGSAKFRRDTDVKCNNFLIGENDLLDAEQGLAAFFGAGNSFSHDHAYKNGSAIAFACDYGRGQTYTYQQFMADMAAVDSVCGPQGAGWNSHRSSKSSYGRTQSSGSYC
ncbi:MAG: hypothetical protein M1813_005972 [Trichoglossum hirsutum]|nr:MAG: hypothetical protein M1813_005972 [Trichoglossum hirsutum]